MTMLCYIIAGYFSSYTGEYYFIQIIFILQENHSIHGFLVCGTRTQITVFVLNVNIAFLVASQVGIYLLYYIYYYDLSLTLPCIDIAHNEQDIILVLDHLFG